MAKISSRRSGRRKKRGSSSQCQGNGRSKAAAINRERERDKRRQTKRRAAGGGVQTSNTSNYSTKETSSMPSSSSDQPRFHFVLVHGSSHGAWCWYKIVHLLEKSGHAVTAVDLAGAGIHPVNPDRVRTWEEHFQPLLHVLQSLNDSDKVVLVGHSAGGISISHALEAFPQRIAVAVFLAAAMLANGVSTSEQHERWLNANPILADHFELFFEDGPDKTPTSVMLSSKILCSNFYQMSPSEDVTLAKMLVKRHPSFGGDPYRPRFTKEKYGSVPRVYIRTEKDLAMPPELQDMLIAENPPDKVYNIKTDHSPFFSAPKELHDILLDIATSNLMK